MLNSLHKYEPCVHIVRVRSSSGSAGPREIHDVTSTFNVSQSVLYSKTLAQLEYAGRPDKETFCFT